MKKLLIILAMLVVLFNLCGCNKKADSGKTASETQKAEITDTATAHQDLVKNEITPDTKWLQTNLADAGLENVYIYDVERNIQLSDVFGNVYLLAADRSDLFDHHIDVYLAIEANGKLHLKDLAAYKDQTCLDCKMLLGDVDGDRDQEIIINETLSASGGGGQYLSRIYDYADGKIVEIYSTIDQDISFKSTGFAAEILKDKKLKIKNIFTGYDKEISFAARDDEYFESWYDKNGNPEDIEILVDSCYDFTPIDIDDDNICEIECYQYVSLVDHSDFIGTAVSVLKFNPDKNEFEIADASFTVQALVRN